MMVKRTSESAQAFEQVTRVEHAPPGYTPEAAYVLLGKKHVDAVYSAIRRRRLEAVKNADGRYYITQAAMARYMGVAQS